MKYFTKIIFILVVLVVGYLILGKTIGCLKDVLHDATSFSSSPQKPPQAPPQEPPQDTVSNESEEERPNEDQVETDTTGLYSGINIVVDSFIKYLNFFADSTINENERLNEKYNFQNLFDPEVFNDTDVIEVKNLKDINTEKVYKHRILSYVASLVNDNYKGARFAFQSIELIKVEQFSTNNIFKVDASVTQLFERKKQGKVIGDTTDKTFTFKVKLQKDSSDKWNIKIQKIRVEAIYPLID